MLKCGVWPFWVGHPPPKYGLLIAIFSKLFWSIRNVKESSKHIFISKNNNFWNHIMGNWLNLIFVNGGMSSEIEVS